MKEDRKRGGVRSKDDDFGDASVQGLCCLVGTLLQLAIVRCLLNDIEDFLGKSYEKLSQHLLTSLGKF